MPVPPPFLDLRPGATDELPSDTAEILDSVAPIAAIACERLSSCLRSLLLFGSCLSIATRRDGSIPDLFALVDSVDHALERLQCGPLVRLLAPHLPPTTLALSASPSRVPIAKLNLIAPGELAGSIQSLPDLYLAGRLSKRAALLHARAPADAHEIASHIQAAASALAGVALLAPPPVFPLDAAVRRCFNLSYLGEIRPETRSALRLRFESFAAFYSDRFAPLLRTRAQELGLHAASSAFHDARPPSIRDREAAVLRRLLYRSRLRSIARWPKQALVYDGWPSYLLAKFRRSRPVASPAPLP